MAKIHDCWVEGWHTCTVCDGRIHQVGCTTMTRPNPKRDCCLARHQQRKAAGIPPIDSTMSYDNTHSR